MQTRKVGTDNSSRAQAIRLATVDTVVSLLFALLVNAAILVLAGAAFYATGTRNVSSIEDAYRLLDPIAGTALAASVFGVALFASGQSSTFTGTIAAQILMEGFLRIKIPCYQRRLITRGLALAPALAGVLTLGGDAVGKMLVMSQVVLSLRLPFAMYPLLRFTGSRGIMGKFVNSRPLSGAAWLLFALITGANLWLVVRTFS